MKRVAVDVGDRRVPRLRREHGQVDLQRLRHEPRAALEQLARARARESPCGARSLASSPRREPTGAPAVLSRRGSRRPRPRSARAVRPLVREAAEAGRPHPRADGPRDGDADGRPSARMVLLKGHDERGFVFFTNRTSRKARGARGEPSCRGGRCTGSLQNRQVRVEGPVERVSDEESFAYFRHAAAREPDQRLGLAAVPAGRRPGRARAARRRDRGALRRRGRRAAAAVLGRVSARRDGDRVLAGPAGPACTTASATSWPDDGWRRERLGP